jgi:hypothetical protein
MEGQKTGTVSNGARIADLLRVQSFAPSILKLSLHTFIYYFAFLDPLLCFLTWHH